MGVAQPKAWSDPEPQASVSAAGWRQVAAARHPRRPRCSDFIAGLLSDFIELRGDRCYRDDPAIVGGVGRFDGKSLVVLGHEKGREAKERVSRNFGMPFPEGYRKACRLMGLAQRLGLGVLALIDTPGAYPGLGAEQRGQMQAIARSLEVMLTLEVPTVAVVIGEGGSGGALALGLADRVLMLENATYSVISPEGCASILWHDPTKAGEAAAALRLSARELAAEGLIDEVVGEPEGGAHVSPKATFASLARALSRHFSEIRRWNPRARVAKRLAKFLACGRYEEEELEG